MKTKEFIKRIEELGLKVDKFNNDIVIGDMHRYYCCLSSKERYRMDVYHEHLEKIEKKIRHELLDLVVEYVKTPIEERKEPKKYYLRLPDIVSPSWSYLNLWVAKGIYYFSCSNEMAGKYKVKFTQEEIDNLPNQEFIKALIKEEVEDV